MNNFPRARGWFVSRGIALLAELTAAVILIHAVSAGYEMLVRSVMIRQQVSVTATTERISGATVAASQIRQEDIAQRADLTQTADIQGQDRSMPTMVTPGPRTISILIAMLILMGMMTRRRT